MKRQFLVLFIVFCMGSGAIAQAPGFFNYQGVARNSVGNVLINKNITLRLSIRDGAVAGPIVYQESRSLTTNPLGLFNVQVGSAGATNVTGTIAGVNWALGAKHLQVEIDPEGGTSFINIGTAPLASVPYSIYANAAGELVFPFNKTQADAGSLFRLVNSGTGTGSSAFDGQTNSTASNVSAVIGTVTPTGPGGFSAGVRGINNGTGGLGIGVYGSQNGSGWGVYGTTPSGIGVNGTSSAGTGVFGTSQTGTGGLFNSTSGLALHTTGSLRFNGINEAAGRILITDAAGNATWQDPSGSGIITGTGTLDYLPKWTPDGTTLGNSLVFDNGTNVGVGTTTPLHKLHVNQAGAGSAGQFTINNNASTSTTALFTSNGIGAGISVQLTNVANGARGIDISQSGVGPGLFSVSQGGNAVWGITSVISSAGVIGDNTFGEAVVGRNRGGLGVGAVVGRNDSAGYGVRGFNTKNGIGVLGQTGISGGAGVAGRFENVNAANTNTTLEAVSNGIGGGISVELTNNGNGARGIDVTHSGVGPGVFSTSQGGSGLWGITSSISAAGVLGDNTFGEAVVGRNRGGNGVGAVVGRNDSTGYGVRGFNTKDGIGVLGQAGISGGTGIGGRFENVNAANPTPVLQAAGNGTGTTLLVANSNAGAIDLAIFRKGGGNVVRIAANGEIFANGGFTVGGADVAEYFEAEGPRESYEPGDVLVISRTSDRKVEKSSTPYSTLVSGVYASKPGMKLTERNATDANFDDMVPMGVIGVIPTKVCLEGGMIKRGDLLVTSSIPGVAMKADPDKVRVGQVLGKALQDYDGNGDNRINVLVNTK